MTRKELKRTKEDLSVDDDFGTNVRMLLIILQKTYALSSPFNQHAHFQLSTAPLC